jgi:PAS domain S-box-containing protein
MSRREALFFAVSAALAAFILSWVWEFLARDFWALDIPPTWIGPLLNAVIAGAAVALVLAARHIFRQHGPTQSSEKEQLLEAVFDNSPSLIYVKDSKSRMLLGNKPYQRFHNISDDSMIGHQGHGWLGHKQAENMIAQDRKIMDSGEASLKEFQNTDKDGQVYWIRSLKFPIFDDQGKATGIGGISSDITEYKNAEAALKANEERYRRLFENSPDAIYVHVNDRFVFVNPAAVDLFGASSKEDLLGRSASGLFHPDERARLKQLRTSTAKSDIGNSGVQEFRYLRLNGEEFLAQSAASTMEWDGEPAFVATLRDLSDRKAAEQAVQESEELYRNLVELSPDAIYMQNDGRVNFMNAAGLKLFGAKSPNEIIGRLNLDLIHPDYQPAVRQSLQRPDEERANTTIAHEQKRLRLDGSEFWAQSIVSPFVWKGSKSALVTVRDISERKRTEDDLRMSEKRYQDLVECTQAAITVHNGAEILYANQAAVALHGAETIEDLLGRNPMEFIHPDERPDVLRRRILVLEHGQTAETTEQKQLRLDGSLIWVECTGNPVHWNGQACVLVETSDITARHRAENDLLIAKESAELANRTKTEFLANVSHELRTPLNAVIGFSEIMSSELLGKIGNSQYKGYCHDIHQSGIHLLNVINDILDISKIEAGKLDLYDEEFDPVEAIESCMRLINERALNGNIDLSIMLRGKLPNIMADERKLKQILLNLLSNAVKFTPEGGRVSVQAEADAESGFRVSVSDTGIGIASNNIDSVLTPFGQVDSALARKFDGTGLGLPLAKSLTELHGGTLNLESVIGSGTTVTIQLPPRRLVA